MKKLLLAGWLFFFVATVTGHAVVTDKVNKPAQDYAIDEIVVKYKSGKTPDELEKNVAKRKKQRTNMVESIVLFFLDAKQLYVDKKDTPEMMLFRLSQADSKVGATTRKRLPDKKTNEKTYSNIYIIKMISGITVVDAVEIYEALPEVEYAEPNYLYSVLGAPLR